MNAIAAAHPVAALRSDPIGCRNLRLATSDRPEHPTISNGPPRTAEPALPLQINLLVRPVNVPVHEFRYFQEFVAVGNIRASIPVYYIRADDVDRGRVEHGSDFPRQEELQFERFARPPQTADSAIHLLETRMPNHDADRPQMLDAAKVGQPLSLLVIGLLVLISAVLFRGGPGAREPQGTADTAAERAGTGSPERAGRLGHPAPGTTSAARAELTILRALDKAVSVDCEKRPLEDAVRDVGRQLDVPIHFDLETLREEGVALDTPVTLHLDGITGRSALHLLLSPSQLEWIIADEVLCITTSTRASDTVDTRVYDVSDLVAVRSEHGAPAAEFQPLIEIVTGAIAPDSWEDQQGPGSIREMHSGGVDALVVFQAQRIHEEIAFLLADLRSRRHGEIAQKASRELPRKPEPRSRRTLDFVGPEANSRAEAVVRGNNLFAFDLYRQLAGETDGNLLVSPVSLSYALAILYAGAQGETAAEIGSAMHSLVPQDDFPGALRSIWPPLMLGGWVYPGNIWWMHVAGRGARIDVANLMWLPRGTEPTEPFREKTEDAFEHFQDVDFSDRDETERTINELFGRITQNQTPRIVTPEDFNDQTRWLVTNANTFKGFWSRPFHPKATAPAKFGTGRSGVEAPMMHREVDYCRYAAAEGLEVLEKPYSENGVSLVILLPSPAADGLTTLEANLSEVNLLRWLARRDSEMPEVFLPRFTLRSRLHLRTAFEALGMQKAFQEAADFSGMFGDAQVHLDEIIHGASVEVDESGTRGSKAADTRPYPGIEMPEPRPVFRADRPFVFILRDNRNGCILFIGRLVNPTS